MLFNVTDVGVFLSLSHSSFHGIGSFTTACTHCAQIIGNLRCHERASAELAMETFKRNAALYSITARKATTNPCRCRTTNAARKESQDGQDSEEGSESESESDHESKRRRKKKKKKNKRRSSHSDDSEGDSDDSGDRKR